MERIIYLDNAATTRTDISVVEEMTPYFSESFGNPSSIYDYAKLSKEAIGRARKCIGDIIGADPEEIYFTSGGSEADNWALKGVAMTFAEKGKHIITSAIEHHAVINSCKFLESLGYEVTYIGIDEFGKVKIKDIKRAIRKDTILISIMAANNEIGTLQPLNEIGKIARKEGILFHIDAVQAFGHLKLNADELNADMISVSAHKFRGPKGVGFLYIRKGIDLKPLIHGGAQERGFRAGTENVPGIVGMAKAARLAYKDLDKKERYVAGLRDYFTDRVLSEIPYSRLNGHPRERLSNNASFSFQFVDGGSMLIMLGMKGICASGGSACNSSSSEVSHVLLSLGLPIDIASGTVRFTFSEENTREEIDYVADELKDIVKKLREISPSYQEYLKEINAMK